MELPLAKERKRSYSMTDADNTIATQDFKSTKERKQYKSDFSDIITVLVGEESSSFIVHRAIICRRSTFFEARCSKRWQSHGSLDAKETCVMLVDIDAAVFSRYLHCLYSGQTAPCSVKVEEKSDYGSEDLDYAYKLPPLHESANCVYLDELFRTYIVADRLGDLRTANLIIDTIVATVDKLVEIPHPATISHVFDNTAEESPLYKLIHHYYVNELAQTGAASVCNDLPSEFLGKVIQDIIGTRKNECVSYAVEEPRCCWHQHNEKVPKCSEQEDEG